MDSADEESRLVTTPGSGPLSPRPTSPRPIPPPLSVQIPPQPVSPTPSHLASPPALPISPLPSPISPPVSPNRHVSLPDQPISPTPRLVSPPVQPISPTPRHISPPVQSTSPLPRHARPISPAPIVIPPLSAFTKKRKSAPVPNNPSKRIRSSIETKSTTARQSGGVSTATAPPPTHQARQTRATAMSLPPNPPTASKSRRTCNKLSPASQSKNTPPLNLPTALTSRRTCNKPTPASSSNNPPPLWFSSSLRMLQTNEPPLGDRWAELVRLWTAFEEKEAFEEHGKLSAKHRPLCIGKWIGCARSPTWRPTITSIPAFEKSFQVWWCDLQPSWRISGNGSIALDRVDGDFEALRKPGLNGILSVMAALFYWGCKVQRNAKYCASWASAVEDCILVLEQLVCN